MSKINRGSKTPSTSNMLASFSKFRPKRLLLLVPHYVKSNKCLKMYLLFYSNMKLESAASSSVEDRVKRNIHSIQRTPASLDNFMKR